MKDSGLPQASLLEARGANGSINQLAIVAGVLASQAAGIPLALHDWRLLLLLTILPSLIQLALAPFFPESPIWLVLNLSRHEARLALASLRYSQDIDREFDDLVRDASVFAGRPRMSMKEVLTRRDLLRSITSVLVLQFAQQASGINVATYYSATLFQKLYSFEVAVWLSLLLCIIITTATIVSLFLIERFVLLLDTRLGRKTLLITSMAGMAVPSVFIGIIRSYPPASGSDPLLLVSLILVFVASFGLGLGSIPWLITPELIPEPALAHVSSLATGVNWASCFFIGLLAPIGISTWGYKLFYLFAGIMVLSCIFVNRFVPETKGRSVEEVIGEGYHRIDSRQS